MQNHHRPRVQTASAPQITPFTGIDRRGQMLVVEGWPEGRFARPRRGGMLVLWLDLDRLDLSKALRASWGGILPIFDLSEVCKRGDLEGRGVYAHRPLWQLPFLSFGNHQKMANGQILCGYKESYCDS